MLSETSTTITPGRAAAGRSCGAGRRASARRRPSRGAPRRRRPPARAGRASCAARRRGAPPTSCVSIATLRLRRIVLLDLFARRLLASRCSRARAASSTDSAGAGWPERHASARADAASDRSRSSKCSATNSSARRRSAAPSSGLGSSSSASARSSGVRSGGGGGAGGSGGGSSSRPRERRVRKPAAADEEHGAPPRSSASSSSGRHAVRRGGQRREVGAPGRPVLVAPAEVVGDEPRVHDEHGPANLGRLAARRRPASYESLTAWNSRDDDARVGTHGGPRQRMT